MSKVFNMVGGGGKNISSIIITGLESTDTIACTKDSKSYTATWDSTAQHWEIVGLPLGTYTVTASNGTKTTTETVLIDIVGVYDIEMDYRTYLYNNGNECTGLTGGWVTSGYTRTNYTVVSGIKENDCIRVGNHTNPTTCMSYVGTLNTVNLSAYSTLCIEYTNNASDTYNPKFTITPDKNYASHANEIYGNGAFAQTGVKLTARMDLSSVAGNYYLLWCSDAPNTEARAYRIWLE